MALTALALLPDGCAMLIGVNRIGMSPAYEQIPWMASTVSGRRSSRVSEMMPWPEGWFMR